MRILELCTSAGLGGLELYVAKSAVWLQRLGHELHCVVNRGTMLDTRLVEAGFQPYHLGRKSKHLPLLAARRLARYIDRFEIDIVHMHWGHDLFLAVMAKRLARRPVKLVYTRQMAMTRAKKDAYHRFLYGAVDRFLTITAKLQEQAYSYLPMPQAHIQLLYYGVPSQPRPDAQARQALRASLGTSADATFLVGSVARIEEQKGQHLVVEAVRRLRGEGLSVEAQIIGPAMDKEYEAGLKREVREWGMEQAIRFSGAHKNPQSLMAAFDVLVLSTRMETFGLVLIEAMRAGTAVVGTGAGGVPEIIRDGETGLMFAPDDVQGLTDALRRLCSEPALCQRLAQAGKAEAEARFSEETHYAKLEEIFRTLI